MPKTLSKALWNRLLRSSAVKQQLTDLHLLSGTETLLLDNLGIERLRLPREQRLPLRALSDKYPVLKTIQAERRQARLIQTDDLPPLPWSELILPLQIDSEIIGYLLLSPFRTEKDPVTGRAFWSQLVQQGSPLSWSEWRNTWEQLPCWMPDEQQAWQRLLELSWRQAQRWLERGEAPFPTSESLPPIIQDTCRYIRGHYHEPLRQQDVAGQLGVSPEHLSRIFHQRTGLRFREYLVETRIQAAKDRLSKSEKTIATIAGEVGFSTLSRFNHAFRHTTGTTPTRWRRRHTPVKR